MNRTTTKFARGRSPEATSAAARAGKRKDTDEWLRQEAEAQDQEFMARWRRAARKPSGKRQEDEERARIGRLDALPAVRRARRRWFSLAST